MYFCCVFDYNSCERPHLQAHPLGDLRRVDLLRATTALHGDVLGEAIPGGNRVLEGGYRCVLGRVLGAGGVRVRVRALGSVPTYHLTTSP